MKNQRQPEHVRAMKGKRPGRVARSNTTPPPKPLGGKPPTCPKSLTKEQAVVFRDLVKRLKPLGILHEADRPLLAAAAVAYTTWQTAQRTLAEQGLVTTTAAGGIKPHPMVAISKDASKEFCTILARFGSSPYGRKAIRLTEAATDDAKTDAGTGTPFDKILKLADSG